jgi:small subunit ribosomal protein S20
VANTKSAAKRARQSIKRHDRNKAVISAVRTAVRSAREAIARKDAAKIDTLMREAASALDKAVAKGVLHKRNASRRSSRLAAAAYAAKAAKA